MGLRALPLSPSNNVLYPKLGLDKNILKHGVKKTCVLRVFSTKSEDKDKKEEPSKKNKQSFFSSFTDAIDFAQVRSEEDAALLEEARGATQSGGQMSREQVQKKNSELQWIKIRSCNGCCDGDIVTDKMHCKIR